MRKWHLIQNQRRLREIFKEQNNRNVVVLVVLVEENNRSVVVVLKGKQWKCGGDGGGVGKQ